MGPLTLQSRVKSAHVDLSGKNESPTPQSPASLLSPTSTSYWPNSTGSRGTKELLDIVYASQSPKAHIRWKRWTPSEEEGHTF